jgi:secondary thiamine-phosphate synthase enzyme
MIYHIEKINIKTSEGNPFHNITARVLDAVQNSEVFYGTVTIYSPHTTLAIKITENCKLMMQDCFDTLRIIAPVCDTYQHDNLELRDVPPDERINGYSHVRQLFMNTSESIPIDDNKLLLGKWQDIFAVELDPARDREIIITVMGE